MTSLKQIWLCATVNISKWSVSPRIYALAAIITAFMIWMFSWISDYASAVEVASSPWVFPFLLTPAIMFLIYGCLTLLLYSDAPFVDNHTPFLMIRTSRRNWIIGQIVYVLISALIFTAYFSFMSFVALIPNVQMETDWGAVLRTIAYDPESLNRYGIIPMVMVGGSPMTQFTAIEAMLISIGLFYLVSVFIGILILFMNILFGGMSGIIAGGAFTVLAYFSVYVGKFTYGYILYYFSPLNWSSMTFLDWNGTGEYPTPLYAVTCLVVSIIVMSIIAVVIFCKRDMNIRERRL